jgi:hypothetical protein
MTTLPLDQARRAVPAGPDPAWRELYRIAGVSAWLATVAYLVALVQVFATPAAPGAGGAATLEYIAAHRSTYVMQQVLWLAPSVLLTLLFAAFYPALKSVNRTYAAVGSLLGVVAWAVTLAYPATGGGAAALVPLSDGYVNATTDMQRLALAAAAEAFIAQNVVPTAMGVLEAAAILIVSLLMLRSSFGHRVAGLGVVAGAIGVVCESLKPVVGLGYIAYGLLLFAWLVAIGWEFLRLSRQQPAQSSTAVRPPGLTTFASRTSATGAQPRATRPSTSPPDVCPALARGVGNALMSVVS